MEERGDAGDGSTCAGTGDEGINYTTGLVPDLGAGTVIMGFEVARVLRGGGGQNTTLSWFASLEPKKLTGSGI